MVKAERAFKWGIAIILIFGTLNAFYFFNLIIAFKIVLPILCVFMIGSILLQSGKGGGLAAIGGLGDQAAFGTRTSTFLTKVTYLIGAAFIVATVFLFKLSISNHMMHTMVTREVPEVPHTHDHPMPEAQHVHDDVSHPKGKEGNPSNIGMQDIEEKPSKGTVQESHHQTDTQGGVPQKNPVGVNPVREEEKASESTK
ncbi:MAG: preprotein translocase subunit SecG [Planctomycetia bacterium]|nr:preprotein translocase subunit SecG [Candidatus Brocadia sp.]QOJ07054.1 MAG: preprotein translocase subunit SecG [Planctomycetia bacterium]TVL96240.1 MAG: preprotein translocase subunit SecG [Candidatus Brocadia sp. BL1]HQU30763.1 preprotein translocase subunit SecG [Candidatus Brocadia sapporoensis]